MVLSAATDITVVSFGECAARAERNRCQSSNNRFPELNKYSDPSDTSIVCLIHSAHIVRNPSARRAENTINHLFQHAVPRPQ